MQIVNLVEQVRNKISLVNEVIIKYATYSNPVAATELSIIESGLGFFFPEALREFYLNHSEELIFSWFTEKDVFGTGCKRGVLNILSPKKIEMKYNEMRLIVQEAKTNEEELAENEGLQVLVNDWQYWIPIISFPNGDAFCIEKREKENSIVFLEHDVMDGGPNLHGLRIAKNFEELMNKWSKIYFVDIYDWTVGVNQEGLDLTKIIFSSLLRM